MTSIVLEAGGLESELVCHLPGVPEEDFHIPADADGLWRIEGLLADETYVCTDGLDRFQVTTEPLPSNIPLTQVIEDDDGTDYRLLGHFFQHPEQTRGITDQTLLIVDAQGQVRWYHDLSQHDLVVDASFVDGAVVYSGGGGGPPTAVSLAGEVLWEVPTLDNHHDLDVLPSGLVAALVGDPRDDVMGYAIEIYDVDERKPVWSIRSDELSVEQTVPHYDAWHANAMQVDEVDGALEAIWVNLRASNELIRIRPGQRDVDLVVGHDWTFVDSDGADVDAFAYAHDPHIDGDRVLLYDNGSAGQASRVVEFELDASTETATQTWSWTEDGWSEPIWGSVDPNEDHVLVGRGHCDDCANSGQGPSQLVEVDRTSDEVTWRLELEETSGLYRARSLDGCEVFANRRYCKD